MILTLQNLFFILKKKKKNPLNVKLNGPKEHVV